MTYVDQMIRRVFAAFMALLPLWAAVAVPAASASRRAAVSVIIVASRPQIGPAGGSIKIAVSAHGASTCRVTASVVVTGLPATVDCLLGRHLISGKIGKISGSGRSVEVTVVARGKGHSARSTTSFTQGGTVAISPKSTMLGVHLDPTYTQDINHQLNVTFQYSAAATQGGSSRPLPSGILDFYSDGLLKCSIAVEGSTRGGDCPVVYKEFGHHTVITEYLSGSYNATETDVEDIEPIPPYQDTIAMQYGHSVGILDGSGISASCPSSLLTTNPCWALYSTVTGPLGPVTVFGTTKVPEGVTPAPAGSIVITVLTTAGTPIVTLTTETAGQGGCFLLWPDTPPGVPTSTDCIVSGTGLAYPTSNLNIEATFSMPGYRPLTSSVDSTPYHSVTTSA